MAVTSITSLAMLVGLLALASAQIVNQPHQYQINFVFKDMIPEDLLLKEQTCPSKGIPEPARPTILNVQVFSTKRNLRLPLVGATVSITPIGVNQTVYTAVTNKKGLATFPSQVPAGCSDVQIDAQYHTGFTGKLTLKNGTVTNYPVLMQYIQTNAVGVAITDSSNTPIVGATVSAGGISVVSNDEGVAVFVAAPGRVTLTIQKEGFREQMVFTNINEELLSEVNVTLTRLLNYQRCGNGEIEGTEECDDQNLIDGDNCSSTCLNEP